MKRRILLVDDESAILNALTRLLSRNGYEVLTANNGVEALALMETESISVVLSDYKMPTMSGTQLLTIIHQQYPETIGLIMSGYADFNAVVEALNSGAVFRFVEKPWHDQQLLTVLDGAFAALSARQRKASYQRLLIESEEALFEIDADGDIHLINPAAVILCDATEEAVLGQRIDRVCPLLDDEQLIDLCTDQQEMLELADIDNSRSLRLVVKPLATDRWAVSAQYRATTSLGVSELLTREQLMSYLQNRLVQMDNPTTVIYLDVNGFKRFNDSLGFNDADCLLAQIAAMLLEDKPIDSQWGRMSGDEFALVLSGHYAAEQIETLVTQLLAPFEGLIAFNDQEIHVSFRVGYAVSPEDGDSAIELIRNAQASANHCKRGGRFRAQRYQVDKNSPDVESMGLQSDLYRALERKELFVVYQPKVSLISGCVEGAEALLRWQHGRQGLISPMQFIPLAEETGLIEPIGEWVMATASSQRRIWQAEGLPPFVMSINLSGRQLQDVSLISQVENILKQSGLAPDQIELEITETFLMQDIDHSIGLLQELKHLGIRLAIDDFGTGYSSLNYLHRIPFDTLKIDRSFVSGLGEQRESLELIKHIIAMSRDLGKKVVAEGVESQCQLELLRDLGCDEIQGFFFSPPVSAERFRRLLENQPLVGVEYRGSSKFAATGLQL
nr:EAL domain-containing protein [uncultured Amphritea sp.]